MNKCELSKHAFLDINLAASTSHHDEGTGCSPRQKASTPSPTLSIEEADGPTPENLEALNITIFALLSGAAMEYAHQTGKQWLNLARSKTH